VTVAAVVNTGHEQRKENHEQQNNPSATPCRIECAPEQFAAAHTDLSTARNAIEQPSTYLLDGPRRQPAYELADALADELRSPSGSASWCAGM
jgi:hypothetical protein